MTSRFGRNKRRAARAEIERLGIENKTLKIQRDIARATVADAKRQAFEMFMAHGDLYKLAIRDCSHALGRALGEELNRHTDKLLSMLPQPLLKFEYRHELISQQTINVLHVHIPLKELHYRTVVP